MSALNVVETFAIIRFPLPRKYIARITDAHVPLHNDNTLQHADWPTASDAHRLLVYAHCIVNNDADIALSSFHYAFLLATWHDKLQNA